MEVREKLQHQGNDAISDKDCKIILVVDDEEIVRDTTRTILEFAGYKVIVAKDGFEAVDRFQEASEQISCVLLDFRMPGKNGEETLSEIREINSVTPVVLVSAYCNEDSVKRMIQSGLSGLISKPYRCEDLMDVLDELVL